MFPQSPSGTNFFHILWSPSSSGCGTGKAEFKQADDSKALCWAGLQKDSLDRGLQTVSVKKQTMNILDFAGCMISITTA